MKTAAVLWVLAAAAAAVVSGSTEEKEERLMVGMTVVPHAGSLGAVCLDGSPAAYHLHRGSGAGASNWLLQFEGGGWCNNVPSCMERSKTRRGSTRLMNKLEVFSGILSNDPTMNPDFYNWNRVKIRYCDGGSFTGDSEYRNGTTTIYFRGQKIWNAVVQDLLLKGLLHAKKALLSGCSAGGQATFHHCDAFSQVLQNTTVKCMSDAGFFLNVKDISGNNTIEPFFHSLVTNQGVLKNLNKNCTRSQVLPYDCFFAEYALRYTRTPYFILNSAYDVYQFHHIFVPPSADPGGRWSRCKSDTAACTQTQISILQGFRSKMLTALDSFSHSRYGGMFINSCFAHGQSELQNTWFSPYSPRINNKTIAETVGDWYFQRGVSREIDCPYPCDSTCQNLLPSSQV